MKALTLPGKPIIIAMCAFIMAMTGLFVIDSATNESLALTTPDCRVCHTGAPYANVAGRHHSRSRICAACHAGTTPAPDDPDHPDRDCMNCHRIDNWNPAALDVTTAHTPLHDMTDVPDPATCNISCHFPGVIEEHAKYPSFAVPSGEMDCDRCHLNTNTDPLLGPINVQEIIALGSGGEAGQVVTCDQCHTTIDGAGHAVAHDDFLPDSPDCATANCHSANIMTEHTSRGWTCATCHNGETLSLDPNVVLQVIVDGSSVSPNPPDLNCSSCHGPEAGNHGADHDQGMFLQAPSVQDCTSCHAAMDPVADPNLADLVTEHVTNRAFNCTTCHDRADQVFDAIDKGRTPSNLPVYCVDCHTDATSGQGKGHSPISADAEPWNRCGICHFINIFGIPLHNMHEAAARDMQKDCFVCHVPEGTRPDCILCHALEQTIWDPLPPHLETPTNDSLNIIGPGTEDHDKHTNGPLANNCEYCHVSGVPGSEPLPAPYNECSGCHDGAIATDIVYGSNVHTISHIQGAEAAGQGCAYCHSQTPACTDCHTIAGPNMSQHETHTDTLQYNCTECHVNGIAGSEPLPEPYDQCSKCHSPAGPGSDIIYGSAIHTTNHIAGGEATPQSCDLCHGATPPAPACTTCHDIAGPLTPDHDFHTGTMVIDCAECHVSGVPGGEPIPAPYNECSTCHNGTGNTTNIMYGQTGHNTHMTAANNDCSRCHTPQPDCSSCHAPGHPPIVAPYNECSNCHDGTGTTTNIMFGQQGHNTHMTAASNNCAVCHNDQPDCSSCHAPGHLPIVAPYNECSSCHTGLVYGQAGHATHVTAASNNCSVCHTPQPDCSACHAPGHPAVPAPYDQCDQCHTTLQAGQVTHDSHRAQAAQDCTVCHTAQPDCSACHVPSHPPVPAPYNECDQCHTTLQPGQATHDMHRVEANQNCAQCHSAQATCNDCHSPGHEPVPAQFNGCDQCHTTLQPTQATHEAHKAAASAGGTVDCTICHSAQATCADCHSPGHPSIPAPYNGCDECHTTIQPGSVTHDEHKAQTNNNCAACHTSSPAPDCSACHSAGDHYADHNNLGATETCAICHTDKINGTNFQYIVTYHPPLAVYGGSELERCATCHDSTRTEVVDTIASGKGDTGVAVSCVDCHTATHPAIVPSKLHNNIWINTGSTCSNCHIADYETHTDMTTSAQCSGCHVSTTQTEINTLHNDNCMLCHLSSRPEVLATITTGIAGTQVDCTACHTFDGHNAAHENAGVPSPGCTNCHDANVVAEHVDNRGFTCATCHDSTDPNVSDAITAGQAGTFVTCYDCHGQNQHHTNTNATSGNCTHCHADPRPMDNDPQQLACRGCHIDNNGYVQTSAPSPSHAFNANGSIQDFGACFSCHAPVPYHAKPTSWPGWYEENQEAPGRGIFNVFKNELQPNCAGDCEGSLGNRSGYGEDSQPERRNDDNWRNPSSFNWYQIDYQGQAMNVPVFDQGGAVPSHPHDRINAVGNCGDCHTVGTVVPVTHDNNCQACHLSNDPAVQNVISQGRAGDSVDCFDCHGSQDHESAHDMTELTDPNCSECHDGNVFTEHVANRTLTCGDCHGSTDPNVMNAIANGTNGTPVPCQDCHGPSAGDHLAAHDNAGAPAPGCINCHDANVVTEHVTNRSFTCATCHDSTDSNVVNAINDGKGGTFVTCNDCHGQGGAAHHDNDNARTGNCTYCHADPRLDVDPNAPTGQLACRQCHVDNSGYVSVGSGKPSHAFNTQGNIQDFGACFDCHQPTPYHAKPSQMPSSCFASLSEAPGKGSFNLFYSEFGGRNKHNGGEGRNERNKDCKDREHRDSNPAIQYNMVPFFDHFNTNQQWNVPYFGTSGGGGSNNDSVNITYASYSSRRDRLTVYAENSLGENATLTVTYDGDDYQMGWDSKDDRWEVRISSKRCNDSSIEVTSSAGGSDSRSVSGCSGW